MAEPILYYSVVDARRQIAKKRKQKKKRKMLRERKKYLIPESRSRSKLAQIAFGSPPKLCHFLLPCCLLPSLFVRACISLPLHCGWSLLSSLVLSLALWRSLGKYKHLRTQGTGGNHTLGNQYPLTD